MAIDGMALDSWRPRALAVLRIVTGYLVIPHGTAKLFGMPHQPMFTRPVAFVLCGFMAVAYFMAHGSARARRYENAL